MEEQLLHHVPESLRQLDDPSTEITQPLVDERPLLWAKSGGRQRLGRTGPFRVYAENAPFSIASRCVHVGHINAKRLSQFVAGWCSPECRGKPFSGLRQLPGPVPSPARRPVHSTQLIDDGATHAHGRIPAEGNTELGIERAGRLDEGQRASCSEFITLHVRRYATDHLGDEVTDEREVLDYEHILL